jgi:Na+/melibiose symporter-like transporter
MSTPAQKLSKKYDRKRIWRSFKRHAALAAYAIGSAVFVTALWYAAWSHGWHFSGGDESILGGAIVTTLGVAYGITAALILNTLWEKYNKVVLCVFKKDKDTFLFYRDERMPIMIRLLLASISLPLIGIVGALDYQHAWSGVAAVFSVSLVLALYWMVATKLEDPAKSAWLAERIPKEWLVVDVDEHFGLGK